MGHLREGRFYPSCCAQRLRGKADKKKSPMEVQKETAHLPLSEDDYPLHEFQFKDMFKETLNILALRIPQGLTGTMLKRLDGYGQSRD